MPKQANELTIQVENLNQVVYRYPHNKIYLEGRSAQPSLGGVNRVWLYLGYGMMVVCGLALVGLLAFSVYTAVWNSSLAADVEGTVTGIDRSTGELLVFYSYSVDGVEYEKREPSPRRSSSGWADGNVPETITYLTFQPEVSRLDFNVEPFDFVVSIGGMIFIGGLVFAGYWSVRQQRRMTRLQEEATHVLAGQVQNVIPSQRSQNIVYVATSPQTGEAVRGGTMVGKLEGVYGTLRPGVPVAVLYADDTLHAIL